MSRTILMQDEYGLLSGVKHKAFGPDVALDVFYPLLVLIGLSQYHSFSSVIFAKTLALREEWEAGLTYVRSKWYNCFATSFQAVGSSL